MLSKKRITNYELGIRNQTHLSGIFIVSVILTSLFLVLASRSALAAIDVPTASGLSTKSLADTAVNIINAFLGLVGVIAFGIFIYGGYLWMFSAGDPKKIALAKKVLISATIGLIIILLSWAIVQFIFNAVNGGPGGPGMGGPHPPPLPGSTNFVVRWIDPKNNESSVPLCRIVQAGFSDNLSAGTVNKNNIIIKESCSIVNNCDLHDDGNGLNASDSCQADKYCGYNIAEAGIFNVVDKTFEFLPAKEWFENTTYGIKMTSGVQSASLKNLVAFSSIFTIGNTTDNTPPQVMPNISPTDGATDVCLIKPIEIQFSEPMRVFSLQDALTPDSADAPDYASLEIDPLAPAALTFSASIPSSDTAAYFPTIPYATNQVYRPVLRADIIQDACLNYLDGNKNGTEEKTPLDDHGDSYIDADGNNAAVNDYSFITGTTDQCVPEITAVTATPVFYDSPANLVTIDGKNFGAIPIEVLLSNSVFINNGTNSCLDNTTLPINWTNDGKICLQSWSDNQITFNSPARGLSTAAIDGPVQVKLGGYAACNAGLCAAGPNKDKACAASNPDCPIGDSNTNFFIDIQSPHIASQSSDAGPKGQAVTLSGTDFGDGDNDADDDDANDDSVDGIVRFIRQGDRAVVNAIFPCGASSWLANQIIVEFPVDTGAVVVNNGDVFDIQIERTGAGNRKSNLGTFKITAGTPGPLMCTMAPDCGPTGTSVAISGKRFSAAGTVAFGAANAVTAGWTDTQIAATSPAQVTDGSYPVKVTVGGSDSNTLPFSTICSGRPRVVESLTCNNATQSPSPYKNDTVNPDATNDACINTSAISARFNMDMNSVDATDLVKWANSIRKPSNVGVLKCNTGVAFDNTQCNSAITDDDGVLELINTDTNSEGFIFKPADGWAVADTWYKVAITANVQSKDGTAMGSEYIWKFHVANSAADCPVSSLSVNPANKTVAVGDTVNYTAVPQGPNCNFLAMCTGFAWVPGLNSPLTSAGNTCIETVSAGSVTPVGVPDTITAQVQGVIGTAKLTINAAGGGGGAAVCGNGAAEGAETCDDGNIFNGDGCSSVCALEVATACNNNDAKDLAGEFCDDTNGDGVDLDGKTCANFGFSGGTLACAACGFDTAGCTGAGGAAVCGNGKLEGGEQCDDKNIFANDGCSAVCQKETPAIFSVKPTNGAVNVCKNAAAEITFTGLMDLSTITATTIRLLQGVAPVAGSLQARYIDSDNNGAIDQTLAIFYPSAVLSDSTAYNIEVLGGAIGVKSKYGAEIDATSCGAAMAWNGADRCTSIFTTGTEICKIDKVVITLRKDFNPDPDPAAYDPRHYSGPDLFTCAGKDDCPDDFAPLTNKNQHNAIAEAKDATGLTLSGVAYNWTKSTDAPFTLVEPDANDKDLMIQADPKSGIGAVTVKADGGVAGIMSASTNVTVEPCDNPWPGTVYPYKDDGGASPTNFSLWYCRDAGAAGTADDLPDLDVIPVPGAGEMIKEFFFYDAANPNDAIGLRVYSNTSHWPAKTWYEKRAPNKQGAPASTTVDGWEAISAGRTIYVNAANHIAGTAPVTNIYLMSHSDKVSQNLQNILGQMKANWKFAITEYDDGTDGTEQNAAKNHLRKLQRDSRRITDLYNAAVDLYEYRMTKGKYPLLPSGSYIAGNSTSVWPSWDGGLSQEVGAPMPHDPISQMSSLVGWWKMDDDSGGWATDDSSRGTDGELKPDFGNGNAPAWRNGAACKFGSCLEFDAVDDYVDLGSFSGLYSNKLTVSAWIKTKINKKCDGGVNIGKRCNNDSECPAASCVGTGSNTNDGWDDIVAGGCGNFVFAVGSGGKLTLQPQCGLLSGGPNGFVSGVKALDDDKWHHVAATYDGLVMKLYVDGVFEKSGSAIGSFVTAPSGSNSGNLFVGYTDPLVASPEYFDGSIDEVRIWNTPLGDTEINNLFKSNAAKFGSSEDSGWDQTKNAFTCSAGADFDTHIYHYQQESGGANFSLYAALEWTGSDNTTWRHKTAVADAYKPCSNPSSCPCYNYRQREINATDLGLCKNGQWDSSLGEVCDDTAGPLTGLEGRICTTGVCNAASSNAGTSCTDNLQCPGGVCTPGTPTCDASCQPFCPGAVVVKAVCGNGKIESPLENCECSDFSNNATCGVAKGLMSEYYCFDQINNDDLGDVAVGAGEIDDTFKGTVKCSPVDCNLSCGADGNPVRAEVNNAIYEPWVEQCEPKRGYCSGNSISCTDDASCGGNGPCIALGNGGYYCDDNSKILCSNGTRSCTSGTLTSCIGGAAEWAQCGGDSFPPKPYNYLETDLYGWCFR